jgi:hypothetical protein
MSVAAAPVPGNQLRSASVLPPAQILLRTYIRFSGSDNLPVESYAALLKPFHTMRLGYYI